VQWPERDKIPFGEQDALVGDNAGRPRRNNISRSGLAPPRMALLLASLSVFWLSPHSPPISHCPSPNEQPKRQFYCLLRGNDARPGSVYRYPQLVVLVAQLPPKAPSCVMGIPPCRCCTALRGPVSGSSCAYGGIYGTEPLASHPPARLRPLFELPPGCCCPRYPRCRASWAMLTLSQHYHVRR
jgi:hypothetical protein